MMNPGPVEEAGQTARSFIDALKGQPATLAMAVVNFALLAFIFYALQRAAESREKLLEQVFQNGKELNLLLSQCRGGQTWLGEEDKPHSSVTPLKSSRGIYVASITQAGVLQGWYCTIPLPRHSISGGTVGPPLNSE
jgi:hypothetical protein